MNRRTRTGVLLVAGLGLALLALPHAAHAQSVNLDLGSGGAPETAKLIQLIALIGVISLAPSLLVMLTAFTRIVIVLSLLRTALGTQTTPPNSVLIGLALFLTYFVMAPVFSQSWHTGLLPMTQGDVGTLEGLKLAAAPFHTFLADNARPADVRVFLSLAHIKPPANMQDVPWRALIPGFVVGELRRGFEMGFMIFLPFMVIDIVISSILMSLGMMMLPPTAVSLPFKIIFFVLVDGWQLVCGSLVRSFPPIHF
ncbi:flagellar type III secretion system pore protein FliP [Acidiphilium sp.]|jgi:flagellar biosynthetic protein FliP|uniref:flagellar type III secretion system pore protein FliP n=1 Tax=Acidiphilium sp. TaxID=527 RepID=UPI002588C104|nr:flagellar type III secretion system pore protein FliP [Acidiphilium sp.]